MIIGVLVMIIVFLLVFDYIDSSENQAEKKDNSNENFSERDIFDLENEELYSCGIDEDCVAIKSGCCDCNNGGTSTAINKDYQDEWNSNLEIECETTLCITAISNHWTCFAEPKCVEGKCELVPSE